MALHLFNLVLWFYFVIFWKQLWTASCTAILKLAPRSGTGLLQIVRRHRRQIHERLKLTAHFHGRIASKDSVQRFRYLYFIHTDQRLLSTLLCGNVYNLNRIEYIKKNIKMVWFPSAKIWIDSYTCMCIQSGQFYSLILVWGLDDSSFIFLR